MCAVACQYMTALFAIFIQVANTGQALQTLGSAFLNIMWPYELANGKWLLYPVSMKFEGHPDTHCVPSAALNPLELQSSAAAELPQVSRARCIISQCGFNFSGKEEAVSQCCFARKVSEWRGWIYLCCYLAVLLHSQTNGNKSVPYKIDDSVNFQKSLVSACQMWIFTSFIR